MSASASSVAAAPASQGACALGSWPAAHLSYGCPCLTRTVASCGASRVSVGASLGGGGGDVAWLDVPAPLLLLPAVAVPLALVPPEVGVSVAFPALPAEAADGGAEVRPALHAPSVLQWPLSQTLCMQPNGHMQAWM